MFGGGWQQFLVVLRFKALAVHVVRDGSKKFSLPQGMICVKGCWLGRYGLSLAMERGAWLQEEDQLEEG